MDETWIKRIFVAVVLRLLDALLHPQYLLVQHDLHLLQVLQLRLQLFHSGAWHLSFRHVTTYLEKKNPSCYFCQRFGSRQWEKRENNTTRRERLTSTSHDFWILLQSNRRRPTRWWCRRFFVSDPQPGYWRPKQRETLYFDIMNFQNFTDLWVNDTEKIIKTIDDK